MEKSQVELHPNLFNIGNIDDHLTPNFRILSQVFSATDSNLTQIKIRSIFTFTNNVLSDIVRSTVILQAISEQYFNQLPTSKYWKIEKFLTNLLGTLLHDVAHISELLSQSLSNILLVISKTMDVIGDRLDCAENAKVNFLQILRDKFIPGLNSCTGNIASAGEFVQTISSFQAGNNENVSL